MTCLTRRGRPRSAAGGSPAPGPRAARRRPGPAGDQYGVHGPVVDGDRAYVGLWDAGWAIVDIADKTKPRTVSLMNWHPPYGGHTHTALPLPRRKLVVVTDESTADYSREGQKLIWVVDVREETRPVPIATFPVPEGDYCARGGHFGPHNVHENRPGAYQDDVLIYTTYWNAGLRIYDLTDPYRPTEVAYYVPPAPAHRARRRGEADHSDERRLRGG